jgi:hypothetical protein
MDCYIDSKFREKGIRREKAKENEGRDTPGPKKESREENTDGKKNP